MAAPNPHGKSNAAVVRPWINGLDVVRRPQHMWIVDFDSRAAPDAALFERPWQHVEQFVKPSRVGNRESKSGEAWWLLQRARPEMKAALASLHRSVATARVAKHRVFVYVSASVLADSQVVVFARADDTTLGLLHSRFHELWSLRMCTWMGKGNDPRYTPTTCFETFPFPAGLTPADTAHQRTEPVTGGPLIPADLPPAVRPHAEAIARAAQRLVDLRDAWLNPPEWTERVPEVVPLGMTASPYPDRIVARPGFEKELAKRTLTNLYNQRPAWLAQAHEALDAAVAAAYGWADYTPGMADDEILRRLLALNLERAAGQGVR
ncbi:MAG: adenine methyltransferase [Methylibium sp. NZG]|nr:MAG: adenine methyltransferase [Methylibium sp. NZG]